MGLAVLALIVVAAGGAVGPAADVPRAGTVEGSTGEPEILSSPAFPQQMFSDRAEYQEQAQWGPPDVAVHTWPEALAAGTHYGIVAIGKARRTFLLTGPPYAVIADVDGDGNLATDERRPLAPETLFGAEMLAVTLTGDRPGLPAKLAFELVDGKPTGRMVSFPLSVRRGQITLGARAIAFALLGSRGSYDDPEAPVFIDHDGDGKLDFEEPYSAERYKVGDGHLDIAGASFAFQVDPSGDRLTLTPQDAHTPERPALAVGTAAPPFRFVDMALAPGSLEEYRGRVVLLYFWFTGCPPCQQLIPHFAELYEASHGDGFEILAVNTADTPEMIREYVASHPVPGRMIAEGMEGAIAQLYRVRGAPVWFLVDREGNIAGHRTSVEKLTGQVRSLLAAGVSNPDP